MKHIVKKRGLVCMMIICMILSCGTVYAYQTNGRVLSSPTFITYKIQSSASQYSSMITTYMKKWDSCSELAFAPSQVSIGNGNINFVGKTTVNSQNIAVCAHYGNDSHTITLYKPFVNLSTSNKQETIVHEVGHALGLAHCQSNKNSVSVMRESGFNNKAYPLSDDYAGISYIY